MKMNTFSSRYSRGVTLIEVLVAVIVVSTGLLGMVALQMTALEGANDTQYRSRATDLAASLADRMRANPTAGAGGDYVFTPPAVAVACPAAATTPCAMQPDQAVDATTTGALNCSTAQMAAYDLWEIRCANGVEDSLPGGTLTVSCADADTTDAVVCSPGSQFTLNVTWQTKSQTAGFTTDAVTLTIIP